MNKKASHIYATIHIDISDIDLLIEKLEKANSLMDELTNKSDDYVATKFDSNKLIKKVEDGISQRTLNCEGVDPDD